MARPWSARCYGVARQREGSRQNSIGPRVNLTYQPYARGGADGQAGVCPLLRGSSPTRGVAPKQENKAIADQSPLLKLSLRSCLLYTSDAADEEDSVDLG